MDAAVDTETYLMQDYLLDISEVESIVFAKYEMKNLTASPSWLGDWQFINPVRFDIADLLPEEEISAAKEWAAKGIDPVQVELVQSENGEKSLRIVNSGDIKQESILIDYQMLDEDGDIIGASNVWAYDLEVGQGTKQKLSPKNGISAIKITIKA